MWIGRFGKSVCACDAPVTNTQATAAPRNGVMNSRRLNRWNCIWPLPALGRTAGYRFYGGKSAGTLAGVLDILMTEVVLQRASIVAGIREHVRAGVKRQSLQDHGATRIELVAISQQGCPQHVGKQK